jgi:monovalent cation/proton antiporter MnhG/PhaG subunit
MVSIAFSVVGLMVARNVYERLHYLSPIVSVGVVAMAAAVVVQESLSQAGINAILTALVIFFVNPILTHASARAARIRQVSEWRPRPEEHTEIAGEDGFVGQGREI